MKHVANIQQGSVVTQLLRQQTTESQPTFLFGESNMKSNFLNSCLEQLHVMKK